MAKSLSDQGDSDAIEGLIAWSLDPANDDMFDAVEDRRAAERGRFTDRMVERGARAIYEMTRGAALPGVVNGIRASHVGCRPLAEAVLKAALAFDEIGDANG